MYQYSEGESYVQEKADVVKQASRTARIITEEFDTYSGSFIKSQLFFLISSMDANNNVWTSIITGKQIGFVDFISNKEMYVNLENIHYNSDDILFENLKNNTSTGILFIDLQTRRRHRINGKMNMKDNTLNFNLDYSFPNCPKYIQTRALDTSTNSIAFDENKTQKGSSELPDKFKNLIVQSDTFFIGTAGKNGDLDASHRGGQPGFVSFISEDTISIPDYSGNNMFISLGNIKENSKVGLLFIDYKTRSILQLQGEAEVIFDRTSEDDHKLTGGTGRFWQFKIDQYIYTPNVLPYSWNLVEYSPFNPL